jgi:uncharacterized OB-fold protein
MALWLLDEEEVEDEGERWPAYGSISTDCAACGHAFVGPGDYCSDCIEGADDDQAADK